MEKCWGFKHKVQDLIDEGWLGFKENESNMNNNPLLAHGGQSINALSHEFPNQESEEMGIPWIYNPTEVTLEEKDSTKEVTNIVEPRGVTRSGRIYTPDALRKKSPSIEVKGAVVENTKVSTIGKEAEEFLKFIRHNEYELLDQMNKTPM
ncbi:hypothetical protein CR513_15911, partial [Mucuna pruriens]